MRKEDAEQTHLIKPGVISGSTAGRCSCNPSSILASISASNPQLKSSETIPPSPCSEACDLAWTRVSPTDLVVGRDASRSAASSRSEFAVEPASQHLGLTNGEALTFKNLP